MTKAVSTDETQSSIFHLAVYFFTMSSFCAYQVSVILLLKLIGAVL